MNPALPHPSPMPVRLLALSAALVLGAGLALIGAGAAEAAESTESASVGAYFYRVGIDKPDPVPAPPPNLTGTATDGVDAEHLATAVRVPTEIDKKSFLFFDLLEVPAGSTITKAVLRIPLAENSPQNQQISPDAAKVQVCAAGSEGFNGEDGASFELAPTYDCKSFSAVGRAETGGKAYLFDIGPLVQTWLDAANDGVAIIPSEAGLSAPFQSVFLPARESSLAVSSTGGESLDPDTGVEQPVAEEPVFEEPASEPGGGFEAPAGGFEEPSGGFGESDPLVVEPGSEELPGSAPAPELAEDGSGSSETVAAGESGLPKDRTSFGIGFWAVIVAIVLGGIGLSRVVGDRGPGPSSPSRIGRTLDTRAPGSGPLLTGRRTP